MKQTVYLQFLPEYDAYGISDEKNRRITSTKHHTADRIATCRLPTTCRLTPLHRKTNRCFFSSDVKKLLYHRYALCQSYCTIWRKHPFSDL